MAPLIQRIERTVVQLQVDSAFSGTCVEEESSIGSGVVEARAGSDSRIEEAGTWKVSLTTAFSFFGARL
jgi:hypothetical protein